MADKVNQQTRSKIMSRVQSKGTKLEATLKAILAERGVNSLEEHPTDVLGHPDFIHRASRLAVFVDSCFWHGCPKHLRMPATNVNYWNNKIARNRRRDKQVRQKLRKYGWAVIAIWEHEFPDNKSLKRKLTQLIKHIKYSGADDVMASSVLPAPPPPDSSPPTSP